MGPATRRIEHPYDQLERICSKAQDCVVPICSDSTNDALFNGLCSNNPSGRSIDCLRVCDEKSFEVALGQVAPKNMT